ncbi:MAG: NAD(+)/NADH kinase [bacterium]
MILALTGNRTKQAIIDVLPPYVAWLHERKVEFVVSDDFQGVKGLESCEIVPAEEIGRKSDVVISFGGDGTFLNTIRLLNGQETPVMGVNLGGLGYLTEVSTDELYDRTEQLLRGEWTLEHRILLEVTARDGKPLGPWYALNDVVVDKAGYARLIELSASIDGVYLTTFRGDGLIVSTPTGSTGYSLSSGGPILEPKMGGILIVPLNPHSLSNRPLVIDDDKTIEVVAQTSAESVSIAVDGRTVAQLKSGQSLTVRRAKSNACVVKFAGRQFYAILRQKLGWGDSNVNG